MLCISASSCSTSNKPVKDQTSSSTSRKSLTSQSRPRTLPLDRSGGRNTPTDRSSNRTQARTRKDTPKAPVATHRLEKKTSRLSAPMLSRVEIDIEPRRASAGSSLSKSKSCSMQSLNFEEEELELTPRGTNKKPRSKWAKSNLSTFASVPNLLQPDDNGLLSFKSSDDSSSVDTNKTDPDINDIFKESKQSVHRSSQNSQRSEGGSLANSRRSSSTSRLNSDSSSNGVEEKKRMTRKSGSTSASNLHSADGSKKVKDQDLIPPPAVPNVKSARQERIAKRANDARRKTTDNSGFSLEEAKEILSGKSVKITEIKENARKKRSTSTSPNRAQGKGLSVLNQTPHQSEFPPITDPRVLAATAEIELTAAELQRQNATAKAMNPVSLDPSPNDPPERDVPSSVVEMPRTRSRAAKSASLNKSSVLSISQPVLNNSEVSDSSSGLSAQEDDNCPSPSVKDRIARLNKQSTDTDGQLSVGSSRAGFRSASPFRDLPRQPPSVQFSVSSSSTKTTVSTNSSTKDPPVLAMTNTSVTLTTSHEPVVSQQTSHNNTFQTNSLPDVSASDMTQVSGSRFTPGTMATSTQSLSPPSGLGASMDSEVLASNLSPGNHSNSSPRSVADTGLGSDTDLETRYFVKKKVKHFSYWG